MKSSALALILLSSSILTLDATSAREDSRQAGTSTAYAGPIIDMHMHAFREGGSFSSYLGQPMDLAMTGKVYTSPPSMEEFRQAVFGKYEEHNIVMAVVADGELWHEHAPEKVVIANDRGLTIEELRRKHEEGKLEALAEIAPLYQGLTATDESLLPYFELAEQLRIPMGFHLFPGGPPGSPYFAYPEIRAANARPLQLEEALLAHPGIKIYVMHAGWPYLDEMKALMYAHPQVHVDIGVIDWILPRAEFHDYLKRLVDAGFGERIMFGTDPIIYEETITDAIEAVNAADFLTPQQKEDIFYNNAARFLELSDDEIAGHKAQATPSSGS